LTGKYFPYRPTCLLKKIKQGRAAAIEDGVVDNWDDVENFKKKYSFFW
jgi:hypothetical protein